MGIINTELSPSDPLDAGIASLEAIDAQFIASIEKIEGFPCGLDSVGEARAALYYSNGPTKLDPRSPAARAATGTTLASAELCRRLSTKCMRGFRHLIGLPQE